MNSASSLARVTSIKSQKEQPVTDCQDKAMIGLGSHKKCIRKYARKGVVFWRNPCINFDEVINKTMLTNKKKLRKKI